MDQTYEELVTWAYLGEVWGERMLERLLTEDVFAEERDHLRLLLALESRTRRTLERVVIAHGLDLDPGPSHKEAEEYVSTLGRNQDWDAFMRETLEIATSALPQFEKMRDLGPDDDADALQETVEHEEAVLGYSMARLAGQTEQAAAAVSAHLTTWARRSVAAS
ncbi:hypothetical protein [Nocardioides sp. LS1]|uniref:hypothetical protein n=1 Tax=Nocardioides sp. LS1 TaxID=1027620 RepID=UPI000F62604E|nr:hypothetical protein [Nocardioides sp. LS1]GCD91196.1 hypothetical protein NLS1_32020 [Nocardioides sp. LS1]